MRHFQPITIIGSILSISIQLSSAFCYYSPFIDRFYFSNCAFVPVSSSTTGSFVQSRGRRFDFSSVLRRVAYWIDLQSMLKQWTLKCQLLSSSASWCDAKIKTLKKLQENFSHFSFYWKLLQLQCSSQWLIGGYCYQH
jgi:hypothetical protein